jgi:hypothetical protein
MALWPNMRPIMIVKPLSTWAWHVTKPKDVGFGTSSNLCLFGLIMLLNPRMLSLIIYWAQHIVEPKAIGSESLSDLYTLGLSI